MGSFFKKAAGAAVILSAFSVRGSLMILVAFVLSSTSLSAHEYSELHIHEGSNQEGSSLEGSNEERSNQDKSASVQTRVTQDNDVRQLLELMGVPEQLDQNAKIINETVKKQLGQTVVNDDLRPILDAFNSDLKKSIEQTISWAALKGSYISAYKNKLSPEDLQRGLEFLRSDSGKNFMQAQRLAAMEIKLLTDHLIQNDVINPLNQRLESLKEQLNEMHQQTEGIEDRPTN